MARKPSVLFVSVASGLHLERARRTTREAFSALGREDVELVGSPKPFSDARSLSNALSRRADLLVVFVASGGTSRMLREALGGREAVLWAHPSDNSLPSALSAREKLRAVRAWRAELAFSAPHEVPRPVRSELACLRALAELREALVLAICDEGKAHELEEVLSNLLGPWRPQIDIMAPEELVELAEGIPRPSLSDAVAALKGIDIEQATPELEEGLVRSVQLAEAIEAKLCRGPGKPVLTLDCFSLMGELGLAPCVILALLLERGVTAVCEADPGALVLMAFYHFLTGSQAWMANLARFDLTSKTITLAHCTACPSLSASWPYRGVLMSHFESGKPVALDIWLRRRPVLLANIQPGIKRLVLARGRLIDSGMGDEGLCRTQALVELEGDIEAFLDATSNHHVLCYEDISEELRRLGRKLGLEVISL